MGWELRRGKLVYYRKVRDGSRVRSVYCGAGERGEEAEREEEERRREKLARREQTTNAPAAPPCLRLSVRPSGRVRHPPAYLLRRLEPCIRERPRASRALGAA